MTVNLDNFERVEDVQGGVTKYEKDVDVPRVDETVNARQTAYTIGEHVFLAMMVSDRGWSVWHYSDNGAEVEEQLGSGMDAQEAIRLALRNASA